MLYKDDFVLLFFYEGLNRQFQVCHNPTTMRSERLQSRYLHSVLFILSATWLFIMLAGCAGLPEFPPDGDFEELEIREIGPGLELIIGRGWTAVRAETRAGGGGNRLSISPPVLTSEMSGDTIYSRHAGEYFTDPAVSVVLTGSPHNPIRFRSGLPQSVSGFYRFGGTTLSESDGLHDALGLNDESLPEILSPLEQETWSGDAIGGFYAILDDNISMNPVSVRDAVSAAGWSDDGSIVILLVIGGRDSNGFSYEEAGLLLRYLGARYGIAMDGGGSARLVWREDGIIFSFPAARFYRAVPNHLIILSDCDSHH